MTSLRYVLPVVALTLLCWTGTSYAVELPPPAPIPLAGDWNPNQPGDEAGFYDIESQTFNLCKTRYSVSDLICVAYSEQSRRYKGIPLIGRWTVDDTHDRPAIYDPRTGFIHLYRYSDCLPEQCFGYGGLDHDESYPLGVLGATPVVGDWDDSGVDSLALLKAGLAIRDGSSRSSVHFFDDGLENLSNIWTIPFHLNRFSVVAGNWPNTEHLGDSLGFYEFTHRFLILFDGQQISSIEPVPTPHAGLIAFSGSWITNVGSIGLYYPPPPACQSQPCHRVIYYRLPFDRNLPVSPITTPNPHLDSRFPDDPGDPGT